MAPEVGHSAPEKQSAPAVNRGRLVATVHFRLRAFHARAKHGMVRSGRRYQRRPPLATTHLQGRVMTDYDNTKKLSGIPPWPVH
jgi:hypothetical protein